MLVKAFRLFVSSTFADFKLERDVLQNRVFPALDVYCSAKGYQFYPIDLRWGVNEEAHLDQRTAEICLGEVRAAKGYPPPNFLIMTGNCYGWVPLPYAIAADEFGAILAWLTRHDRRDEANALNSVYELDENHRAPRGLLNALPDGDSLIGVHVLRSREELSTLKSAKKWAKLERRLRSALEEAADALLALGQISADTHGKYFLSLTEQEIIAGLPRYWKSTPPLPPLSTEGLEAIAFIRGTRPGSGNAPEDRRLKALKEGLARALPSSSFLRVKRVPRSALFANALFKRAYLLEFATEAEVKLKSAIGKHIARVEAMERSPDFALESEHAAHRAFAMQKLKVFIGRQNNLAAIADYLAGAGGQPLVLHGRSGLGKSALMARASAVAEASGGAPVIARFIGASAVSSNLRSLLISLIEDLAAHGIVSIPDGFEPDVDKFNNQIEALLSSIEKPVTVFLDALDQLQKPHILGWLPRTLPGKLKLVLSVINDPAYEVDSLFYRTLKDHLAPNAFLEIEPLLPQDGREILLALESQSYRRLQDGQRDYLIGKFEEAEASPLYLKTAFEIAKSWKSSAKPGEGRYRLPGDTADIIGQFIAELTGVLRHEAELVTRTLGYLCAAKNGLSEKELTEVLSSDAGVMRAVSSEKYGAHAEKLPPSVWVRLHRDLAPFLVEKLVDEQPLLTFFHRQVTEVAREQHYEVRKWWLHEALAAYFESQSAKQDGRSIYGKRSLSELPYQLHHAGDARRLGQILESPDWIDQKFNAFDTQTLVRDYEQFGQGQLQNLIGRTLKLTSGICKHDKRQLMPQLHGRLMSKSIAGPFCAAARKLALRPALLALHPSLTPPGAELARLEGHGSGVKALAVLADGRLASGGKGIILWDLPTRIATTQISCNSEVTALVV